jgi:signal transduction histidine kinase/CheY-like chemotaxis protein
MNKVKNKIKDQKNKNRPADKPVNYYNQKATLLFEDEKKFKTFLDQIDQDIFACNNKAVIVYANNSLIKRTGRRLHEIIGEKVYQFYPQFDKTEILNNIQTAFSKNETVQFRLKKIRAHFSDYSRFCLVPLTNNPVDTKLIMGIVLELSGQTIQEEQLRQSQKLEAIGKLAGGIAHDFNNLIAVIRGCSRILLSDLNKKNMVYENVLEIDKAGERAALLVQQLLAFSRRQVLEPKVLNLNDLIHNLENMISRIIPENIEMWMHLNPELYPIFADPGQIEQVIVNLIINARDSMPKGGRLSIRTRNFQVSSGFIAKHPYMIAGDYVLMEVHDIGEGIPKEIFGKIFEPFFTTKNKDKGTGLGLSTVFGIVKQSHGYITVDSEKKVGTVFSVYLPRTEKSVLDSNKIHHIQNSRGNETILVVEDEPGLNGIICKMLRDMNYKVLTALSGNDATKISAEYKDRIHLLLTDVVMPGMNGRELADTLKQDRKDLLVIYMSGYTDDQMIQNEILHSSGQYIQKPFTPEALTEKIVKIFNDYKPVKKIKRNVLK